jgi:hypothetical protein
MRRLLALALLLPTLAWATGNYTDARRAGGSQPEHYYQLNETSGTTANDTGFGTAWNGTYTGGFTLNQTGIPNNVGNPAVLLNGSTGYVNLGSRGVPFNANASGFTGIHGWVKLTTGSGSIAAQYGSTGNPSGFQLNAISDGRVHFKIYQNTGSCNGSPTYGEILSSGSPTACPVAGAGGWCFIYAITEGAGGGANLAHMRLYANGVLIQDLTSFSGNFCQITTTLTLGAMINASLFTNGLLDEVGIDNFNTAGATVAAWYNLGINLPTGGWPFTVKRPALPRFFDDGYFAKAARRGYGTGHFAAREPLPQYLTVGYLPFQVMPSGAAGR